MISDIKPTALRSQAFTGSLGHCLILHPPLGPNPQAERKHLLGNSWEYWGVWRRRVIPLLGTCPEEAPMVQGEVLLL